MTTAIEHTVIDFKRIIVDQNRGTHVFPHYHVARFVRIDSGGVDLRDLQLQIYGAEVRVPLRHSIRHVEIDDASIDETQQAELHCSDGRTGVGLPCNDFARIDILPAFISEIKADNVESYRFSLNGGAFQLVSRVDKDGSVRIVPKLSHAFRLQPSIPRPVPQLKLELFGCRWLEPLLRADGTSTARSTLNEHVNVEMILLRPLPPRKATAFKAVKEEPPFSGWQCAAVNNDTLVITLLRPALIAEVHTRGGLASMVGRPKGHVSRYHFELFDDEGQSVFAHDFRGNWNHTSIAAAVLPFPQLATEVRITVKHKNFIQGSGIMHVQLFGTFCSPPK
jgi:hypothetical protein